MATMSGNVFGGSGHIHFLNEWTGYLIDNIFNLCNAEYNMIEGCKTKIPGLPYLPMVSCFYIIVDRL